MRTYSLLLACLTALIIATESSPLPSTHRYGAEELNAPLPSAAARAFIKRQVSPLDEVAEDLVEPDMVPSTGRSLQANLGSTIAISATGMYSLSFHLPKKPLKHGGHGLNQPQFATVV